MKIYAFLPIFVMVAFVACTSPQVEEEQSLPMEVAQAYGFDNMEDVESLEYTFNVQVDSTTVRSRSWKWNVKSNEVYYEDQDTALTYSIMKKDSSLNDIDNRFINDKYWLLFPFQLAWDSGYEYETLPDQTAPISGENTTKLTIVYNDTDGYTPGDAYDLYLGEDNRIKEWVFRRGNGTEGRPMTWENVQDFNGIDIALDHKDASGKTFLWFSDVAVN